MGDSLTLRRYPPTKISDLVNDGGFPTIDLPTTVDGVAVGVTTAGELRTSSVVKVHASSSDKLEFGAEFGAYSTAADGATVTFNFDTADQWKVTLGGNRMLAFTHASVGQVVKLVLYQDGTGDRTPTWWSNINWDKGIAPIIDPTAAGWNAVVLMCIGTDTYGVPVWLELCRSTSAPRRGITTATDGATVTFDTRVSPDQQVTLGGNRTLAIQSKGLYVGLRFTVKLIQDGTGSRTVTWWSTINWAAGVVPTLTTTANKADRFMFECTDASGSPKFEGYVIGQGLAI